MSIPYLRPGIRPSTSTGATGTQLSEFGHSTITVTGEKQGYAGHVWFPSRAGTKDIVRIGIYFKSVIKAGGSNFVLSLQDLSTTDPPTRPNEIQDEFVAIANADPELISNNWYRSEALSSPRTVAFGESLSVVIEYDAGGRQGVDHLQLGAMWPSPPEVCHMPVSFSKENFGAPSWVVPQPIPNVMFEFSDGTWGTFAGAFPISAINTVAMTSASSPNEYALAFTVAREEVIDAASCVYMLAASDTATGRIRLYDASDSVLAEVHLLRADSPVPAPTLLGYANPLFSAPVTVSPGQTYRLALAATGAGTITFRSSDVADAAHWVAHAGDPSWCLASRTDGGAWSSVSTRRPFLWPHVAMELGGDAGAGATVGVIGPIAWVNFARRVP